MSIPTWTIMALSLGGAFEGERPRVTLMFPSYAECSAQINTMRAVFEAQGLDVIGVHCIGSSAPSVSPFPRVRPK
jgi:hypothetical protein